MPRKVNRRRSPSGKKQGQPMKSPAMSFQGTVRILGMALFFGSGLFAFAFAIEKTGDLSVFEIKEIQWLGLKHLKRAEMENRFQSVVGKNLFHLDIRALQDRLLSNQWIKEATVKKSFPDRVLIIVVERKPASVEYDKGENPGELVNLSSPPFLIDQEGVTLQQGGPYPPDLPRLINLNQDRYADALNLGELTKYRSGVFIDLSDPDNLVVYFAEHDGKNMMGRLHFGVGDYQKKWKQFLSIEADLAKREISQWEINLRFPGNAVVKTGATRNTPNMHYF